MMSKHLPGARVTVASLSFSGRVVIKRDEAPERAERPSACWVLVFCLLALLAVRLEASLTSAGL